ncbi:MAG: Bax inhibitor-1/YccA family protein, partial [Gammaproteobacteria bacterium]|nr:Bax inhibitor-1/YccA family protein [Gammaproteobacteria bacterium]
MPINFPQKTGNPALKAKAFQQPGVVTGARMTVNGTIGKSLIMLALLILTAGWCWSQFITTHNPAAVMPYVIGGVIGGLVFGIATPFKPTWAPVTAPLYA